MKQKILLISSLILGLLIAYIDSRPTWDDTGITVLALLVGGGIIGLLVRKHPWLFAFAFGLWIPLYGIIFRHDFSMSVVLFFPFVWIISWLFIQRSIALEAEEVAQARSGKERR